MAKKLTLKERVEYLRIGMGLAGIPTNNMTAELIVRLYMGISQKGGSFNLEDAANIEVEVTGKYTEKEVIAKPEQEHSANTPVVCSAYYVHIAGQGETCVVAENIADATDKIEKLTEANYTFIFNRSLPCII